MVNQFKRFFLPLAWIVPPIAGVMAIPFMLLGESYRVNWGLVTALIALHWVIICYLVWLLVEPKSAVYRSPRAIQLNTTERILVVEGAEWLGQKVGVTVFENTEGYERQLGLGEVFNVQADGLVQIRMYPFPDDVDGSEMAVRLGNVTSRGLGSVIIKPGPLRILG